VLAESVARKNSQHLAVGCVCKISRRSAHASRRSHVEKNISAKT